MPLEKFVVLRELALKLQPNLVPFAAIHAIDVVQEVVEDEPDVVNTMWKVTFRRW